MSKIKTEGWNHKQSFKEVMRHVLFRAGLFSLLTRRRQKRGFITDHLGAADRSSRFDEIYKRGVWRHAHGQAADSGLGSEVAVTSTIRRELPGILRDLGVERLIDVGCGDWTWMSQVKLPCYYVGLDVVRTVVDRNTASYGSDTVSFQHLDAVDHDLPDCDAVLCREVIFHLSFEEAGLVLDNIKRHARWIIVTCDPVVWFNSDIPSGDFRMLNLHRAPFRFPAPDRYISDDGLVPGRFLGVWRTDRIGALCR